MTDDATRTLFHPFETGLLDSPDDGARMIFYGAQRGLRLPPELRGDVLCIQGFRPDFLALTRVGHRVEPAPTGDDFALALIHGTRHRGQNEAWISDALERVRPGGRIVVAAAKGDGGDSLRKRMAETLPLDEHLSKYHGVVFWMTVGEKRLPKPEPVSVDGIQTLPGMFSAGRVDPGSAFLAETLPKDLKGEVADFCAGWGYLAKHLTSRQRVTRVDLYEADHASLGAAEAGLASTGKPMDFIWKDLASEPLTRRYDEIVMNPPFHASGHKADPGIAAELIRAAAAALKPRGRLTLVANRALPYEAALGISFAQTGEAARNDSFKVLWGQGPRKAKSR